MDPLHVVVTVPYFSETKYGGAELWCRKVARGLIDRGHTVEVVTTNLTRHERPLEPKAPSRGEPWGIPTRRHRVSVLAGLAAKAASEEDGMAPLAPGIVLDRAFERADVALVSGIETPTAGLAAVAARLRKTPILLMPHTHMGLVRKMGILQRLFFLPLEGSAAAYVQLNTEAEAAFWQARLEDRRILPAVGCGVDPLPDAHRHDRATARERLGLDPDEDVVLFLGRLHWRKGVLRAVEAVDRLGDPDTRVHLVGFLEEVRARLDGEPVTLPDYLDRRWPDGPWELVGAVDEETKHLWLSACDVLVLPSHHESFGIVFLEAWQHGKPVIGWDRGGMPAVVDDGEDGLIVDSIDDLAAGIRDLLDDPERARRMGQAGRKKVAARYAWSDVAARVEANLRTVLEREAARLDDAADRTADEILEVEP